MRLSILDQSPVITGRAPAASIRESLALARHVEALGYHRYWVSEHHNSASVAGSAPEILIAAVAATTHRIRVGSAGVMLPHYAPYKVAEQFRVLEAIAPGRIDLGLGRAPGSDMLTAHALNPNAGSAADRFPADIRDLLAWLAGEKLVERHPFRDLTAQPQGPGTPEVWILGSSQYGAQVAAHFGLPYCFAHFITDGAGCSGALTLYRELYQPSARHPMPQATICIWALAADSEAAAEEAVAGRLLTRLWRDRGVFAPLPSPEDARAALAALSDAERVRLDDLRGRTLYGTAPSVGARLRALAAEFALDEMAILTATYDDAARHRSYELLAREFGLTPQGAAP